MLNSRAKLTLNRGRKGVCGVEASDSVTGLRLGLVGQDRLELKGSKGDKQHGSRRLRCRGRRHLRLERSGPLVSGPSLVRLGIHRPVFRLVHPRRVWPRWLVPAPRHLVPLPAVVVLGASGLGDSNSRRASASLGVREEVGCVVHGGDFDPHHGPAHRGQRASCGCWLRSQRGRRSQFALSYGAVRRAAERPAFLIFRPVNMIDIYLKIECLKSLTYKVFYGILYK